MCFFFFFYCCYWYYFFFFFFQAEDGIRDGRVTGVQTCALPILRRERDPHLAAIGTAVVGVLILLDQNSDHEERRLIHQDRLSDRGRAAKDVDRKSVV